MIRKYILCFVIAFISISNAFAQNREILYSVSLSDELRNIATNIQKVNRAKVPNADITQESNYFARIIPRKYVLTKNNEVQENAVLGTKPFVFFTTPEGIYGKSLLEIYLDIGYAAEDIIKWQRNQDMIVVVFRYPENIALSDIKNGDLPKFWDKKVYIPTWDNVFSVFHKLTENGTIEPNKRGAYAPERLFFASQAQKAFILNFPKTGKEKIKTIPYTNLKVMGGENWRYRKLLDNKLSIFEHFQGNGRTLNAMKNADNTQGLLEFIGPNMKIKDFPEFAIIHLGTLVIGDSYESSGNCVSKAKALNSN
ncbi:MAG: hypothetical protein KAI83_01940 [Thiomargarita sp.]|nr:hypothetical protein [Thiomargarita sp.]